MLRARGVGQWLAMLTLALPVCACSSEPDFAIVIRGGTVIDGSGAEAVRSDVGVKDDRIAAIGDLGNRTASMNIDASGRVVAPGFIDVDSLSGISLLADGFGESHLRQGITTEIVGADSPAFWTARHSDTAALRAHGLNLDWNGINGYLSVLESRGSAINVGTLVPTSAVPRGADAAPFFDAALRDGAFGVIDDAGSDFDALLQSAAVVGRHDGALVVDVENPAAQSDEELSSLAVKARRVVIDGLSRAPAGMLTSLIPRIMAFRPQETPVYGVATPYPSASGGEDAVFAALQSPSVIVATHSASETASTATPALSEAAFGAFPRLLGQQARGAHLIELREAIRRITSMPAAAYGLARRGLVRETNFADLVIFDPAAIEDRSTADKPAQYPAGVEYVIVNGVVVLTPRGLAGSRPGYGLRHRER